MSQVKGSKQGKNVIWEPYESANLSCKTHALAAHCQHTQQRGLSRSCVTVWQKDLHSMRLNSSAQCRQSLEH